VQFIPNNIVKEVLKLVYISAYATQLSIFMQTFKIHSVTL